MPAWSTRIANEFIRLAVADGRDLNQSQLQKLIYIAHGWRLAFSGEPLTGDRPEAWSFGPVYHRLANALAAYGNEPVRDEIPFTEETTSSILNENYRDRSDLDAVELDLISLIYQEYGGLKTSQLSNWTRKGGAPWAAVFADGAGDSRDISHQLVRSQFVELARQSGRAIE